MIVCGEEILVPAHLNYGKFILNRMLKVDSERTCLVDCARGESVTYGEFLNHAVSLSAALTQLGVERGDIVLVGGEPRATLFPTAVAVILAGAVYANAELECGRAILVHKLNLTKPKYVICSRLFWEAHSDILKESTFIKTFIGFETINGIDLCVDTMVSKQVNVAEFEPTANGSDVAMVVFSSGTTGASKGVQLTHLNFIADCCLFVQWYNEFENQTSHSLQTVFFPDPYHNTSYDFFMVSASLCTGKTVVYAGNELNLKILQDFRVNIMPTVPPAVEMMLEDEEYDLSSLKLVITAGSVLHPTTARAFRAKFPNTRLINLYGASEVGPVASRQSAIALNNNEITDSDASVGKAAPGVTIKVVDVQTRKILGPNQRGEICVRGPHVMKGYLEAESCLDEQGYYSTGDLGYFDDHKHLYLVDRLKDIIICDLGYKVCPQDVETVLLQHPGVREAVVVGVPIGASREIAAAFVVLHPGAVVTEAELQDYVAKELIWYMCLLGGVRFLTEMPRNNRGKIMRRTLTNMLKEDGIEGRK